MLQAQLLSFQIRPLNLVASNPSGSFVRAKGENKEESPCANPRVRPVPPQERHLLVKVIDRILYKLDELVRPYVHKILVVIEPLLIDEDYYARVEGREIISNLSKAAGLATMIAGTDDGLLCALAISRRSCHLQTEFALAKCSSKRSETLNHWAFEKR